MRRALIQSIFRDLKQHLGRFIAMACIVLLGSAFFVGVRATGPDMRVTAQAYYNEQNFSDIRLLSGLGFDEEDLEEIKASKLLKDVSAGYSADVLAELPERTRIIRLMSCDSALDKVNLPLLLAGRLPQKEGEATVDEKFMEENEVELGDTVNLSSGSSQLLSDILTIDKVLVVGVARSPLYPMVESRGSSNIGRGVTDAFFLLHPDSFAFSAYTEIFATINNESGMSRFVEDYQNLLDPVVTELEELGKVRAPLRYENVLSESYDKIADAESELDEAEAEIADAAQKIADAEIELADNEENYADAEKKYNKEIDSSWQKLADAEKELRDVYNQLNKSGQSLGQGAAQWQEARAELDNSKKQAEIWQNQLGELRSQTVELMAYRDRLYPGSVEYAELSAQIEASWEEYTAQRTQLDELYRQIDAGENALRSQSQNDSILTGNAQWEQGRNDYTLALEEYKKNIATFEEERDKGQTSLTEARDKLDKAKLELADARAEYETQVGENEPKISSAREDIAKYQKDLEELTESEWYVFDLHSNEAFAEYKDNCNRVVAISGIFPLIFFLVAALISLTAMTRTVEDDRTQLGLLKALGYGKSQIAAKYIIFAVAATALGLALGLSLGFDLFPRLIVRAYEVLFRFPQLKTSAEISYGLLAVVLSLSSTLGPALFICLRSLAERPAQLMQVKAPLPGRKVFLEYISIIWRRLSFLQKVTVRNIFRYGKRLLMTLLGIAGCTALLFTGFGLNKSINSVVANQCEQVMVFDCVAQLSPTATSAQREEAVALFGELTAASSPHLQRAVEIDAGAMPKSVQLCCPLHPEVMDQFIRLRDSATHMILALPDDGLILTEKAARILNIKAGDNLRVKIGEGHYASLPVKGLSDNYVDHYLYLSPNAYTLLFDEEPKVSSIHGNLKPDTDREALSAAILDLDGVISFRYMDDIRAESSDLEGAMGYIVIVLLMSAAALAFVVLFSLSDINVEERRREIATIKVLGFYEREAAQYINRETLFLSLFGAFWGLFLGVGLFRFVIAKAEVDMIVFSRETSFWSYLWSYLMTVAFTLIVNWIMGFRLRKIDMIESMKSVE